jgi:hypothetical protein
MPVADFADFDFDFDFDLVIDRFMVVSVLSFSRKKLTSSD